MKPISFNESVYAVTSLVPMGKVTTYAAIARAIGSPRASRAVGNALGANTNPIVVPCHRVVRSDGDLGGYSGGKGAATKAKLLEREGVHVSAGKVNLSRYLYSEI